MKTKKRYEAPRLRVHGDIREVTAGSATGAYLDADFAAGTKFSDLTFSG